MRRIANIYFLLLFAWSATAQLQNTDALTNDQLNFQDSRPKLVVGIVVDQMRYDYLTRFYNQFGEEGFKRMIREGFNFKNTHFNYIPTYTGPGHASVYTGTTPKYHGIISNNWYDKVSKKIVYCAGDEQEQSVGTLTTAGKMSPRRMKTTSFADENRLFTQMRGKTIGISLKDRGAILPAGGSATAAYWFQGQNEGKFITSTFYMNQLPSWVQKFNSSDIVESYFKVWKTYKNINTYKESGPDLNAYEYGFNGKVEATFPYDLEALKDQNGNFDILRVSPFGNSILTDFALASIKGESLGSDRDTDVLAISYSSTDYIGHNFGANSKEVEDTYIRLDKELERLFQGLDKEIGKGEYTVFLTSDHGAVHVPAYLGSFKIQAGYFDSRAFSSKLRNYIRKEFQTDLIENISNNQVFLNRGKIDSLGLDLEDVQEQLVDEIITYKHIDKAYSASSLHKATISQGVEKLLQNGYNQKRSGDVLMVLDPAVISYPKTGSTHGSGFNYDSQAPLLFFGKGIKQGSSLKNTEIIDIAPTISALLGISFPNGNMGKVLYEALD